MKIIDFMKKNSDKSFMFVMSEGVRVGHDIAVNADVENSYFFEGYDAFVNFKLDNRGKYREVYKPLLNCEIGKDVEPYYLDDSCIVFCHLYLENQSYWAKKEYFEANPHFVEYLKARAQECTCAAQKVG